MEELKKSRPAAKRAALLRQIFVTAGTALVGFCLSAVRLEGEISPFALAFAAGALPQYLAPAALGGAAGALLFQPPLAALKYAGALTLLFLCRAAHDRFLRPGREAWLFPLASFGCMLVCGCAVGAAAGTDAAGFVIAVCEALVSGACACFSFRVFRLLPQGAEAFSAGTADSAVLLLSGGILLLGLDCFRVLRFSFAHVLACFCVLLLGRAAGAAAAGAAGICAGLTLGFTPENVFLAYLLPSAGLLCGVISGYGRLAEAGAFCVLGAAFILLKGTAETAVLSITEVLVAAVAFALLPKRWVNAFAARLRPLTAARSAAETKALVRLRLKAAAKAVKDISDSVQAVCRLLAPREKEDPVPLTPGVRAAVCDACEKNAFCWEGFAPLTGRCFASLEAAVRENGKLSPADVPKALGTVCRAAESVEAAFEREYWAQNAFRSAKNEISDVKIMAAAQFGSMAEVLSEAAENTVRIGETDPYAAALAGGVFTELGFRYSALCVSAGPADNVLLEIFCTQIPRMADYGAVIQKLREKLNVSFMPPVQDEYKREGAVLSFCETPPLIPVFYKRSAPATGEELCGDAAEGFYDGRGCFYVVLSDGMGTGRQAAIDSVMTCSLFSRLMKAGFSPETALGAVNGALLVKSEDESLATLDVLKLDLYSGKAWFYKAGGSFSAVRRGGKTAVVEQSSLPLGIMRETRFAVNELTLSAGDAVLLMSDGAAGVPKLFFKDLFYAEKEADAKTLAEKALSEAVRRAPAGHADDITVACVLLRENGGA